jgi:dolichyl-phosphate beta-glucosyltransferase
VFGEPTKDLSIIIPAYNEEDRLPATLTETLSYLQRRRDRQGAYFTWEVIIVDDGSKDGTVRAAADFVRKHGFDAVRVLRLPRNRGKGYAGAPACWALQPPSCRRVVAACLRCAVCCSCCCLCTST